MTSASYLYIYQRLRVVTIHRIFLFLSCSLVGWLHCCHRIQRRSKVWKTLRKSDRSFCFQWKSARCKTTCTLVQWYCLTSVVIYSIKQSSFIQWLKNSHFWLKIAIFNQRAFVIIGFSSTLRQYCKKLISRKINRCNHIQLSFKLKQCSRNAIFSIVNNKYRHLTSLPWTTHTSTFYIMVLSTSCFAIFKPALYMNHTNWRKTAISVYFIQMSKFHHTQVDTLVDHSTRN